MNHLKFGGTNHISGTDEARVVKFCTQVWAMLIPSTRMPNSSQKEHGHGHETHFKFWHPQ